MVAQLLDTEDMRRYVAPIMEVAREEVFGPVAPIIKANDEKETIKIANDSKFGLGASIWTQNLEKAEELSSMVESGIVTINNVVISDPRVPFGGINNSRFGRELSRYGMLEFVNIKSVRFYDQLVHGPYVGRNTESLILLQQTKIETYI